MHLTPTELDRLTIFTAAELARRRRARGWKLTHPEALAIICDDMHEAARGGASYDGVVRAARSALTVDDVLDGVADLVGTVKIECLFGDGMRVLHVERPIGPGAARRAATGARGGRGSRAGAAARAGASRRRAR
jgi:urease gamma subunit